MLWFFQLFFCFRRLLFVDKNRATNGSLTEERKTSTFSVFVLSICNTHSIENGPNMCGGLWAMTTTTTTIEWILKIIIFSFSSRCNGPFECSGRDFCLISLYRLSCTISFRFEWSHAHYTLTHIEMYDACRRSTLWCIESEEACGRRNSINERANRIVEFSRCLPLFNERLGSTHSLFSFVFAEEMYIAE